MSNCALPVLKQHKLSHLPELRVSDSIFENKFARGCSIYNCNAACCKGGVMVDVEERQNILAHADTIKKYMEPHQDTNHERWFEEHEEVDLDFPSGRAVGTQVRDYGCVFLDRMGRCVLQTAALQEGMSKFALKPFFCFGYPITIEDGVLTVENPAFTGQHECCSTVAGGELSVFDVCLEELEHVLGKEGVQELIDIARLRDTILTNR